MQKIFYIFIISILTFSISQCSNNNSNNTREIKKLKTEISVLENKINTIKNMMIPIRNQVLAEKIRVELRKKFLNRIKQDEKKYSKSELKKAEELYQTANQNWRSKKAKENLLELIKDYPEHNRAGCAMLYLAQWSHGTEQKNYLKKCIQNYSDCFYGNGVQVGALARLFLANHYKANKKIQKANKLYNEIKNNFPTAIDHSGQFIIDLIKD